jgi:hypothetical protein
MTLCVKSGRRPGAEPEAAAEPEACPKEAEPEAPEVGPEEAELPGTTATLETLEGRVGTGLEPTSSVEGVVLGCPWPSECA